MENEYLLLQGLNDEDLRLNLLHWCGLRMEGSKPREIMQEAEALFGYVRYGVLVKALKTPVPKNSVEKIATK